MGNFPHRSTTPRLVNMQVASTIAQLREQVAAWRKNNETIALVPTMGNLHVGHLQLVTEAQAQADHVIVSIFVNPMQFVDADGRLGDFDRYPRTLEADLQKLAHIDMVFTPSVEEVYPTGFRNQTRVEVPRLSDILCGKFRPGHFVGVATVVAKLFNIAQPDIAVFGEKDFQQLLIIRRMTAELCLPIDIVGVPTVREANGLAVSSRNQYLSAEQQQQAGVLHQTLQAIKSAIHAGNSNYAELEAEAMKALAAKGFKPDYVAIRRTADLEAPAKADEELVVLAAAWLGSARLIDNLRLQ